MGASLSDCNISAYKNKDTILIKSSSRGCITENNIKVNFGESYFFRVGFV